jgi:hypothetical protein
LGELDADRLNSRNDKPKNNNQNNMGPEGAKFTKKSDTCGSGYTIKTFAPTYLHVIFEHT